MADDRIGERGPGPKLGVAARAFPGDPGFAGQLGNRDDAPTGQPVLGGYRHTQATGEHDLLFKPGQVVVRQPGADTDDGHSQPPGPQLLEQGGRRPLGQGHLKARVFGAQPRQRPGRQHGGRGRERTQLDPACQPVVQGGQVLPERFHPGQDLARVLDHDRSGGTDPHAAALADEQRVSGGRLHRGHLPRDRRLRITEQPRRSGERSGQRDLPDDPQTGHAQLTHKPSLSIRKLHQWYQ